MSGPRESAIDRIELYPFALPLKSPFKIATMTAHHAPNLLACITTVGGVKGWGEASIMQSINGETESTVMEAMKHLAEWLIGRDVREPIALAGEMKSLLPGQYCAHCALEIALWDCDSQIADQPLWQRLGAKWRPLLTDMTISAVSPEQAAVRGIELAKEGYKVIKLKIGTGVEEDTLRYQALRTALDSVDGSIKIRLDANQGYSRRAAHEAFVGARFDGAEYCEQPLKRADLEGMAWLSSFSRVPVMADESAFNAEDVMAIVRTNACPMVNLKLTKSGGIFGALQAAAVAEAGGLECMMGGMVESRIGVTAAGHAASSRGVFKYFDLDAHKDHAIDPVVGGMTYEDGYAHLPSTPGLGAHPDPDFLAKISPLVVQS